MSHSCLFLLFAYLLSSWYSRQVSPFGNFLSLRSKLNSNVFYRFVMLNVSYSFVLTLFYNLNFFSCTLMICPCNHFYSLFITFNTHSVFFLNFTIFYCNQNSDSFMLYKHQKILYFIYLDHWTAMCRLFWKYHPNKLDGKFCPIFLSSSLLHHYLSQSPLSFSLFSNIQWVGLILILFFVCSTINFLFNSGESLHTFLSIV